MVEPVLKQLDAWYREPTQGGDRPKLLAKLALLELCGWLEGEFDRLVTVAQDVRLNDPDWVKNNVLDRTHGFTYNEHFRPMLARLVGEIFVRRVEQRFETVAPGELERLKSMLGALWKQRCSFAHADMSANIASQQTFSAPSWSSNQFRVLSRLLKQYEETMLEVLAPL